MKVKRVILIVLDSVGIGELPDAAKYGDEGANTLANISKELSGLSLANLEKMGLGKIHPIKGIKSDLKAIGSYGKMGAISSGKDTTTGHWELAGIVLKEPFPTYPNGFPDELINKFKESIGRDILGNEAASGTKIIEELGEEHIKSGKPIVYTSADSVFQIAAHEDIISVEELYDICRKARKILTGEHAVARVIARPFIGETGNFTRTDRREDFSLEPFEDTVLDKISQGDKSVYAVGKIIDIFAGKGVSESNHTVSNMDSVDALLDYMDDLKEGLLFVNLVEFDMSYGHRRNVEGYANALQDFDQRLPEIMSKMNKEDILFITADHGCDPTFKGTDHTREYVPILAYGDMIKSDYNIGVRKSFADLAASISDLLNVEKTSNGESFAEDILQ
ncbi:phosphopentomutase [Natronospora cellulosivora (SeqCode)]